MRAYGRGGKKREDTVCTEGLVQQYPVLMRSRTGGAIVLFTSNGHGTTVFAPSHSGETFGYQHAHWNMNNFDPIHPKEWVELRNKQQSEDDDGDLANEEAEGAIPTPAPNSLEGSTMIPTFQYRPSFAGVDPAMRAHDGAQSGRVRGTWESRTLSQRLEELRQGY